MKPAVGLIFCVVIALAAFGARQLSIVAVASAAETPAPTVQSLAARVAILEDSTKTLTDTVNAQATALATAQARLEILRQSDQKLLRFSNDGVRFLSQRLNRGSCMFGQHGHVVIKTANGTVLAKAPPVVPNNCPTDPRVAPTQPPLP